MDIRLNDIETRVLGALMEKEMATPEYYPLSLNALVNACNQKSNRNPVVNYSEEDVLNAIDTLISKKLVNQSDLSRVSKYEEMLIKSKKLITREAAVICILLLRGPQTTGEIRGRTDRLYTFTDLDEVHQTIKQLDEWGLLKKLPRRPGHKESRFIHLFSDLPENIQAEPATLPVLPHTQNNLSSEKTEHLENEISSLRSELEELKQAFLEFKNQFN